MYNLISLFDIEYFIFGFMGRGLRNPVFGILNKSTKEFVIDYTGESTTKAREMFLSNDLRLPIIKIDGLERYRSADIHNLEYLGDSCFTVDMFSLSSLDQEEKGYITLKDKEKIKVNIGLLGNLVWSTGKAFEVCGFTFEYDEYFGDFNVDIDFTKNIEVIRRPYKYDD